VFDFLRRLFARPAADPLTGLDSARLRIIVGLGNPGPEYAGTRHNVGFRCVDTLAQRCAAAWQRHPSTQSLVALGQTNDLPLLMVNPQTYMNRSGGAVAEMMQRVVLDRQRLLVVYDDMDLPFGALRLRERGSPGTHNGMRSVVSALGEGVPRLRIGIGQATPGAAIDHVLSGFSDDEEQAVNQLVNRAADAAYAWATENAAAAMNRYNKI